MADSAQLLVGGFMLPGPFGVTEEVGVLANTMTITHSHVTMVNVFAIGDGALDKADDDRDPEPESDVAGIPIRLISLIVVA